MRAYDLGAATLTCYIEHGTRQGGFEYERRFRDPYRFLPGILPIALSHPSTYPLLHSYHKHEEPDSSTTATLHSSNRADDINGEQTGTACSKPSTGS